MPFNESNNNPFILVINSGSSSIKCSIRHAINHTLIVNIHAEKLGDKNALIRWSYNHPDMFDLAMPNSEQHPNLSFEEALFIILSYIKKQTSFQLVGIGHRVVHGGETFSQSVLVTPEVIEKIKQCCQLAPLHNPVNIKGIELALRHFPELQHVAVFDTAFHQTLPQQHFLYGLPFDWYTNYGIRKYGFHGTSFRFIADDFSKNHPSDQSNTIICHLGNGSSLCAIRSGKSVDTSMGFTPLDGLIMGTRCGRIDPSIHEYIADKTQMNLTEITQVLNHNSGLLGLSENTNDMRELERLSLGGHHQATLAIQVFCFQAAKELLGLCASLDRLDAIIFTGGIGENSALIRLLIVEHLGILNITLDSNKNQNHGIQSQQIISSSTSPINVYVIKTDEELMITQDTYNIINKKALS